MKQFKFNLPVSFKLGRTDRAKKKFQMNMNGYRNMRGEQLNNAKIRFKEEITDQLKECPVFDKPVKITYKWYPGQFGRADMDNVMAVMKKFFQDALVESDIMHDDDGSMIMMNVELVGHVDHDNPRVEAVIEELSDDYVALNSMECQYEQFLIRKAEELCEELREDGCAIFEADLFRSHFNITGKLNKKAIGAALFDWFGFKDFVHKRQGKYLILSNCK